MREIFTKRTALLVTNDPAVELIVKHTAAAMGDDLRHLKTNGDAMCGVLDAFASDSFAILDLDTKTGSRALLNTAAGHLPVIVVTNEAKPWLSSMLRHRRIGATLSKPVSIDALKQAFLHIRHFQAANAW
jgi:hypothetical protein